MRYKDEVKGSAELNWLNDLLESQPIEAISINRKTAELLLNYADKALTTQENEQAGCCIQSAKPLQTHDLQIPERSMQTIDTCGVPLDMICLLYTSSHLLINYLPCLGKELSV